MIIPRPELSTDAFRAAHRANLVQLEATLTARHEAERDELRRRLEVDPTDADAWAALLQLLHRRRDANGVLHALPDARTQALRSPALAREVLWILERAGRGDEARALAAEAYRAFPSHFEFALAARLLVPALYATMDEIERWRNDVMVAVHALADDDPTFRARTAKEALHGAGQWQNFFITYQNRNDREFQMAYGRWLHRTMHRVFPDPPPSPPRRARIRVAFASDAMCSHVIGELFLGWVEQLDRSRFEVVCVSTHDGDDEIARRYRAAADSFVTRAPLAELVGALRELACDAIVYLGLGPSKLLSQLAALRLAPLQAAAWGHPTTSGLPTIDYFLTGEAIESPRAAAHYSERLVRLPGIGVCYPRPEVIRPLLLLDRESFGVAPGAVAYICGQSPQKYLPDYDEVLLRIARAVPEAQFVFVLGHAELGPALRTRIGAHFARSGLDWGRHEVVLPMLSYMEYQNLLAVGDVFLDSIGWSAGYSALDAVACAVPMIAFEGEFFRSRQSAGILRLLGLDEAVASDHESFVRLAIRAAKDVPWRGSLASRLREPSRLARVFDDRSCIPALERFLVEHCGR